MSYHHQKRIRLLDIFRGIAILGTLGGTNIWIFAYLGDISYIFTFDHYEWWSSIDHFIRILSLSLVNGKLLGLLAIMFGIGLELKYQQSLRKGRPWPGVYLWTSLFLLIEGFLHFTFVMEYDILMAYAIAAIIVAFIVKAGMKYIKRSLILIGVIHLLFILLLFLAGLTQQISGNFLGGDMQETTYLYENKSWLDQIQYRLSNFLSLRGGEAIFTIPLNVFLFLTGGVLLMRKGAFANDAKGRYIRRKMLQIGLCVGLPLNLLLFVPGGLFDFPVRYLFAPILSIVYGSYRIYGRKKGIATCMGNSRKGWKSFAKLLCNAEHSLFDYFLWMGGLRRSSFRRLIHNTTHFMPSECCSSIICYSLAQIL